jgi:heme A synthase
MAGYLILHGGFLLLLGVLAFLSNPEKANTPLLAFGAFGALAAGFGVMGARDVRGSLPLAVAALAAFIVVCAWRAVVGWLAVIEGQTDNLSPTIALSLMLAASAVLLAGLIKTRKKGDSEPATGPGT